jgi:hypothetical protein
VPRSGGERRMVKVVARPPETRAGTAKRRRSPPLEFQTDVSCVSVSPRPWGCDETRHLGRLAPRGFHDPGQRSTGASANCGRNVACVAHAIAI